MQRLDASALRQAQARTLSAPRMRYSLLARVLFLGMDLFYGRRRTLSKFKVLELIARVPYQAWEQVGYVAMTHTARDPGDHAEHEYMEFVRDHPDLERQPFDSVLAEDYGRFASQADLFRQIGYDERVHKEESLGWLATPRFS